MENNIQYIKAFNYGYLLAKFKKGLITKISDSLAQQNSFTQGLKDGKDEYEIEYLKEQTKVINTLRSNNQDRENDLVRD